MTASTPRRSMVRLARSSAENSCARRIGMRSAVTIKATVTFVNLVFMPGFLSARILPFPSSSVGQGRVNEPSPAASLRVLEFFQNLIEREATDLLARREFLERGDVFPDVFLRGHEQEGAGSPPVRGIHADKISLFERLPAPAED